MPFKMNKINYLEIVALLEFQIRSKIVEAYTQTFKLMDFLDMET